MLRYVGTFPDNALFHLIHRRYHHSVSIVSTTNWILLGRNQAYFWNIRRLGAPCAATAELRYLHYDTYRSSGDYGYHVLGFGTVYCEVIDHMALYVMGTDFQSYSTATDVL